MNNLFSTSQKHLLALAILVSSLFSWAAQADYVQVKCTNHAGQLSFNKALLLGAEYQLNNLALFDDPRDERFPEIVKYLTTIPGNKRQLNTRQQIRRHKGGCSQGVCKYIYYRVYFPQNEKPVFLSTKAQFCANDPTAVKLRKVLTELENYSVED